METLCPRYFDLFHVRYGTETLLTESHHNLDLALVAAVWRYTKVVGKAQYRFGVDAWPPPADWSRGLVAATTAAPRVERRGKSRGSGTWLGDGRCSQGDRRRATRRRGMLQQQRRSTVR